MEENPAEEIRHSEEAMLVADLAALVTSIPNPALIVDHTGEIVAANSLVADLVGEDVAGRSIESLLPARFRQRHVHSRAGFTGADARRPMGQGRDFPLLGSDGTEIPTEVGLSRIATASGPMTLAIVVDARQRIAQMEALQVRALTDPLTGLANRAAADEDLRRRMRARAPFSVLAVDLDGLRDANSRHGHAGGDELIQAFARRLRMAVREEDLIARIGGDEFLVAISASARDAVRVGARVTGQGAPPVDVAGQEVPLTASVGIAERRPGDTRATLTARADAALFAAKAAGRCAVAIVVDGEPNPVVVHDIRRPEPPGQAEAGRPDAGQADSPPAEGEEAG